MKKYNHHNQLCNPQYNLSRRALLVVYVLMIGAMIVLGLLFDDGADASELGQPSSSVRIEQSYEGGYRG